MTNEISDTALSETTGEALKGSKPVKAKKPAKVKAKAKKQAKRKVKAKARAKRAVKAKKPAAKAKAPTARKDSKQAQFIAAMQTAKGISIEEAAERFGWQKHTVRGAVAGALRVKLSLKVEAERDEKRGTVYRIAA